jgi:TRAP-type mannitol/chloroaromatic compound transport system permease small subunit
MIEFLILTMYFLVPFAIVAVFYEYVIKPIKSFWNAFKNFGETY